MAKGKWYTRWWFVAPVLVLVVLAGVALARMGGIEVVENAAALKAPGEGPAEFSILTYNVQARPWFDDARHKFKHISPLTNRFDICAFQECFKQHGLLWAAAEHPVKVYHSALRNPFKIVGSGLGILGKFPLVATDEIRYADPGDFQNWPASKGVLMARFNVNGMMVDVYTTHIAAGGKPDSRRAKPAQTAEIVEFVRRASPPENAVILLGDFNMRPSRGPEDKEANKDEPRVFAFDRMRDALGLRDASDEINGPVGQEIDRILFRPGKGHTMTPLSWQMDDPEFFDPAGRPLSDHPPVFVTFRLEKAQ